MLRNPHAYTKLPVSDPQRARTFYVEVPGLTPEWEKDGHVWFDHAAGSSILIFPSSGKASGDHNQCGWAVEDVEAELAEFRARGVVFEEFPGGQFVDGITVDGYFQGAWFRESEGNLLNVRSKTPRGAQHSAVGMVMQRAAAHTSCDSLGLESDTGRPSSASGSWRTYSLSPRA